MSYPVGMRVRFFEDGEVRDAGTVVGVKGDLYLVKWDEAPLSSYVEQRYRRAELVAASAERTDGEKDLEAPDDPR